MLPSKEGGKLQTVRAGGVLADVLIKHGGRSRQAAIEEITPPIARAGHARVAAFPIAQQITAEVERRGALLEKIFRP